jgi:hypothetical protein
MDGMRVVRVEVDEDGDGKVDRWEYHNGSAPSGVAQGTVDKTIERIERATQHDGKVSRWERFDKGALVHVEGTPTATAWWTSGRTTPEEP